MSHARRFTIIIGAIVTFIHGASATLADVFSNVPETSGYSLVYTLPLPTANISLSVPYSLNNAGSIADYSFTRIGYYLELDTGSGLQWVYASFDAAPFAINANLLGVPISATGEFYRYDAAGLLPGQVRNMNVFSNVGGIITGTGITTGNVEFWPSNYNASNQYGVPGASPGTYDFGDGGASTGVGHGSMQIHNYGAGQTLFAISGFNQTLQIGIGNQVGGSGNPDWTFATPSYTIKNLQIVVNSPNRVTWNGGSGGSGPLDGSGTWNGVNANWWDTGTTTWTDGDSAVFGAGPGSGAAGTITVSGTVKPSIITFNPTGDGGAYTLNGGTIDFNGGSGIILANVNATIATTIDNGSLFTAGAGTLFLTGNNTYSGETRIMAGILNISADNNLGSTTSRLALSGGTLQFGGAVTLNAARPVILGANSTVDTQGNTGTIAGVFTSNGFILTKVGTGTLALTGGGTLTTLTLNGGIVDLGSTDIMLVNAGANGIIGSGGIVNSSGGGRIILGSGSAGNWQDWSSTAGGSITINAVIANDASSRGIDFFNSGTMILKGANTYSGDSRLSGTAVQIGVDPVGSVGAMTSSALGTGPVNIGANAAASIASDSTTPRTILNAGTFNNNVTLGGTINNGKLTFSANFDLTGATRTLTLNSDAQFDGVLSSGTAGVGIIKAGPGVLTFGGANTFTGGLTINAGTVTLTGANGALANSGSYVIASGTTLWLDNTAAANNTNRLKDTGTVTMNGGAFSFSHTAGAVNYSETAGTLTIAAGANSVSASQAAGGQTSALTFAGLTRTVGSVVNFTGTGLGADTKNKILFTAAPTLGGWATYNSNDFAAYGANGITAATYTDIDHGGSITAGGASNLRINGGVSGNVTLNFAGTGSISTLLQNTTTAGTVDTAGTKTLQLSGIMIASGMQSLTIGTAANSGTITPNTAGGDVTLINNSANVLTINSIIANNTSTSLLNKTGTGTVTLNGANTYTGTTLVGAGTLRIGNATALGTSAAGTTVAAGATLELAGALTVTGETMTLNGTLSLPSADATWTGGITFNTGAAIDVGVGNTLSLTASTTSSGAWTKSGGGTLRLRADPNGGGTITVAGGTLSLDAATSDNTFIVNSGANLTAAAANAINDGFGVVVNSGGTYSLQAGDNIALLAGAGVVTRSGAASAVTLGVGSGNPFTFDGTILDGSGTISFNKINAGAGTLTGANTYTGGTTLSGGTLSLTGANGAIANSGSYVIGSGTVLRLDNTGAANNTDRLNNAGTVTMNGGNFIFATDGSNNAFSESVGTLNIASGVNTVSASQAGPSGSSTLTFAGFSRTTGAVVNFTGTGLGVDARNQILFASGTPTFGAWATYNGVNFAGYGPYGVTVAASTDINHGGSITDGGASNMRINGGTSGNITLNYANTGSISTLLQNTDIAGTVDTAGKTLQTSGIMIGVGRQALTIGTAANSGTLMVNTAGGELYLINNSVTAPLTINAVIANNTSASPLILTSPGTVVLNGANTYTGTTTFNTSTATLILGNNTALGAGTLSWTAGNLQANTAVAIANPTVLLGNGTITGSNNLTLNGSLINSGGNRQLTVNTIAGAVTTLGGTVNLSNDGTGRTLTLAGSGILTVGGNIVNGGAGAGALTINSTSTITLNGANTYTGATTLSAGTVILGNSNGFTSGAGQFNFNGGTVIANTPVTIAANPTVLGGNGAIAGSNSVTLNGTFTNSGGDRTLTVNTNAGAVTTLAGRVNLSNDNTARTFTLTGSGTISVSGTIVNGGTGAGNLTKTGTGLLTLSGANTYSGRTQIAGGGTLVAASSGALGTANTVHFGTGNTQGFVGALVLNAAPSNAFSINFNTPGSADGSTYGNSAILQLNYPNPGPVLGSLKLSQQNTLTITAGALATGTPTLTFAATGNTFGSFNNDNWGRIAPVGVSVSLGAAAPASATYTSTLQLDGTSTGNVITGVISDNGTGKAAILKQNTSTWTLGAANTYTGGTTISGGTLQLSGAGQLASTGTLTINSATATFDLNNLTQTVVALSGTSGGSITLGSGALTVNQSANTSFNGVITGTGSLTKSGAGALTLSGTLNYSGATTINAGTLTLGWGNSANTGGTILGSGTITMNQGTTLSFDPSFQSNSGNSGAGSYTFGGAINLSGSAGTATMKFSRNDTKYQLSGGVTGAAGVAQTLAIIQGSTGGAGDRQDILLSGVIADGSGGTLGLSIDFAGASGTGQNAFVNLSGQNTFTGPITVTNSKGLTGGAYLTIGGEQWTTTHITPTQGSGYLGGGNYANTISLATGVILDYFSSANQTLSGTISGAGALIKEGTGTLTLTGVNTYSGGTSITGGTLIMGSPTALGTTAGGVTLNGAVLDIQTDGGDNGYNFTINSGFVSTISSDVKTGSVGINHTLGTMNLGNSTLNITKGVNVASGSPKITFGSTFTLGGGGTGTSILNPTTADLSLGAVTSANAAHTLQLDGTSTGNTITGVISTGTGLSVIKNNTSTWTLSGANTYTGGTTISGGTLALSGASGAVANSGSYVIGTGATLRIDNTAAANNGNRLNNTGTVTINGGAFIFSNDNSNTAFSEFAGTLALAAGANTVATSQAGASGSSTLTFAGISRATGTSVNFSGTGLGTTQNKVFLTGQAAGVMPWATVNLSDWASYSSANGVTVLASYTDLTRLSSGTKVIPNISTANVRITEGTGTAANLTLVGTTTINTLNQGTVGGSSAATITFGGGQILGVNSILVGSGAGALTVGAAVGQGTLRTATAGGELALINNSGNPLTINSIIADNSASSLSKSGSGTVTLATANSYTGATLVNAGTLRALNNTALGTTAGGVTVATAATLELGGGLTIGAEAMTLNGTLTLPTGNSTYGGGITFNTGAAIDIGLGNTLSLTASTTSSGAWTKLGGGTLRLRTDPNGAGVVTVAAGVLSLDAATSDNNFVVNSGATLVQNINGNAINDANGVTVNNGGTFDLGYAETIAFLAGAGVVTKTTSGAATLTIGSNNTSGLFAGVVQDGSGTLSFAKTGSGTATLTAVSTYTGVTTASAGVLSIAGAGSLSGSSSYVVAGGTLRLDNTAAANSPDRLNNTSTVTMNGGSFIFANDAAAGVNYGETVGTLSLNTGVNTVTGGQAAVGQTSALTFAALAHLDGATVNFTGTGLGALDNRNRILFTTTPTLGPWATYNTTDYAAYDATRGIIAASYTPIFVYGGGIPNDSTLYAQIVDGGTSGNITMGSGTTAVNTLIQNSGTAGTVDTAGKTLQTTGIAINATKQALTVGVLANDGTLMTITPGGELALVNNSTTGALTINAVIADNTSASTLTKIGAGLVTLAGANTYSGSTSIGGGTLSISANNNLGAVGAGAPLFFNGGALQVTGTTALDNGGSNKRDVTLFANGTIEVTAANTATVSGNVTGNFTLTKVGTGALALTGANTTTSQLTVGAGTTVLGNSSGIAWNGNVVVSAGATLTLNNSEQIANGNTISIQGGVWNLNGQTETVKSVYLTTAAGTITGGGGTIILSNAGGDGIRGQTAGGIYTVNAALVLGSGTGGNGLDNSAGGTGSVLILNGVITEGVAGATFEECCSAGTVRFNNAGSYTGQTLLNTANTILEVYNDGTSTFGRIANSSTISINNATTTFRVMGGGTDALRDTIPVVFGSAGTFDFQNPSEVIGSIQSTVGGTITRGTAGSGVLAVGNNNTSTTFSGVIQDGSGTLGLTKTGGGSLTLSAQNTYTGATTINGGVLLLSGGADRLSPATSVSFANAAGAALDLGSNNQTISGVAGGGGTGGNVRLGTGILTVNNSTTFSYGGVISGLGGSFVKNGSGTQVLTGYNTYTGATTINAGVLELSGSSAGISSSSAITINGGTFRQNSNNTRTGTLTFGANGGTITGIGVIDTSAGYGGLTVGNQAVLSPGNSPGMQNFLGNMTWTTGGKYVWEIDNWAGVASNNWDFIKLGGTLSLATLTQGNQFTIEITGLGAGNLPEDFDRSVSKTFPILWAYGGISNFSANTNWFKLNADNFGYSDSTATWSIYQQGDALWLQYTSMIPEPTTVGLLGLGGLLLLVGRRVRSGRNRQATK